ncbi:MAG: hypothetical protein IT494_01640 [Gammaproteobacteria bacterium]|nr:hypothetical protein [Gammaproteobacteria bacterium]
MPVWLIWFLLIVFVAHLAVFARLALRHRNLRYSLVTLTFVLLVASFSLRLGAPEWTIGRMPVHWMLRYAAWAIAAITISWLIHLKVAARRAKQ